MKLEMIYTGRFSRAGFCCLSFVILYLLNFMPSLYAVARAVSGPDNRYCGVGNIPKFGTSDGPALLPQNCFYTAMSATPSPGSVIVVPANSTQATIQADVNNLECGQTLQFLAGDSYNISSGGLTFPAKNCASNHWITVETSGYANLPPEGTRISPCWAGVTSLPGRPPYSCPPGGSQNTMSQLSLGTNAGEITVSGDHYRFIGLDVTRTLTSTGQISFFQTPGASYIIYDRVWIHGNPTQESQHAIGASDGRYIALIDSYVNDIKCIAVTGACTDAQAYGGGLESKITNAGVYKIVDDFLEASGENILFGGGASLDTPADIEIRENYFYKPMTWNPVDPSYAGTAYIVKNLFELKNAQRLLLEGNVMDNVWGGYTQDGAAILLTPKSQASGRSSVCHNCFVENVTIRYNSLSQMGQALQISNGPDDNGGWATAGNSYSIHDDVFDGLVYPTCYECTVDEYDNYLMNGTGSSTDPMPASDVLHDVFMNHITEVPYEGSVSEGLFVLSGNSSTTGKQEYDLTANNSILNAGDYGIVAGDKYSCGWNSDPIGVLDSCWVNYSFAGNVVSGGLIIHGGATTSSWPSDNNFPADYASIGFANLGIGLGGDYQLCHGPGNPVSSCAAASPYMGTATDGTDPGANINLVNSYIVGVTIGTDIAGRDQ